MIKSSHCLVFMLLMHLAQSMRILIVGLPSKFHVEVESPESTIGDLKIAIFQRTQEDFHVGIAPSEQKLFKKSSSHEFEDSQTLSECRIGWYGETNFVNIVRNMEADRKILKLETLLEEGQPRTIELSLTKPITIADIKKRLAKKVLYHLENLEDEPDAWNCSLFSEYPMKRLDITFYDVRSETDWQILDDDYVIDPFLLQYRRVNQIKLKLVSLLKKCIICGHIHHDDPVYKDRNAYHTFLGKKRMHRRHQNNKKRRRHSTIDIEYRKSISNTAPKTIGSLTSGSHHRILGLIESFL